jgi:hypothetical protein
LSEGTIVFANEKHILMKDQLVAKSRGGKTGKLRHHRWHHDKGKAGKRSPVAITRALPCLSMGSFTKEKSYVIRQSRDILSYKVTEGFRGDNLEFQFM